MVVPTIRFLGGVLTLVMLALGSGSTFSRPSFPGTARCRTTLQSLSSIFCLGWTLVGWVVALAMAVRDVPDHSQVADSPREVGTVEDLNQLADLHERGLLTDEEFAAAKRRTLTE